MQVSIKAEPRSDFGKGAARRTRRAGLIPAVIYGKGTEPRHVSLPDRELTLALRHPGLVLEVTVDGKAELVAPRDVQRDPLRRVIEHIDLVLISKSEAAERIEAGVVKVNQISTRCRGRGGQARDRRRRPRRRGAPRVRRRGRRRRCHRGVTSSPAGSHTSEGARQWWAPSAFSSGDRAAHSQGCRSR